MNYGIISQDLSFYQLKLQTPPFEIQNVPSFTTKDGRSLRFFFLESDPSDNRGVEKGYVVQRFEATISDQPVGYLKIAYIPDRNFKLLCPNIEEFLKLHDACLSIRSNPDDFYQYLYLKLNGHYPRSQIIGEDLLAATTLLLQDVRLKAEQKKFKRDFVDKPYVNYVSSDIPRQGIASSLYQVAALFLATKNLALYSGLTNDESQAVWRSMEQNPLLPIRILKSPNRETQYSLDYRKR
jgi:hypothetical protein